MAISRDPHQTLNVNPRVGHRAYEELRPRLEGLDVAMLAAIEGIDVSAVASRLLELVDELATEPLRQRFAGLPLTEYNPANLDMIEKASEAVLFLDHRIHVERSRGNEPSELVDALVRVWTILVEAYEETRAAALFLLRSEPELLIGFQPLDVLSR